MKQISVKLPDNDYKLLKQIEKDLTEKMENMFGSSMKIITITDAIRYCIATTANLQQFVKEDLSE